MRMQDPLFHNYYPFQDRTEEHEANEKLLKAQGPCDDPGSKLVAMALGLSCLPGTLPHVSQYARWLKCLVKMPPEDSTVFHGQTSCIIFLFGSIPSIMLYTS